MVAPKRNRPPLLNVRSSAVSMAAAGIPRKDIARRLGVAESSISTWLQEAKKTEMKMSAALDTLDPGLAEVAPHNVYEGVVAQSAVTKYGLVNKIERVIDALLDQVMAKVEDADLATLIDAITNLLDRVESLTYRPQAEDRSNRIVEALVDRATPEQRERVQHAVVETLKRRGVIEIDPIEG